jgi:hypothetical protein
MDQASGDARAPVSCAGRNWEIIFSRFQGGMKGAAGSCRGSVSLGSLVLVLTGWTRAGNCVGRR